MLKSKAQIQTAAMRLFEVFADRRLQLRACEDDDSTEAGPDGIIDGIIDDDFSVRSDRIDLLKSTVAAADARGQNEKRRLVHVAGVSTWVAMSAQSYSSRLLVPRW